MDYQVCQLDNGLRVVCLPSEAEVVYCGIGVKAGTRHEQTGEEGLAHFCEHLSFKGTEKRSAVQIINAIEGLGGELNAFTNKEDTVYYCAIQRQHFMKAVDVLCDIVFNSVFPQEEVEKEREVVCEEIESYEDTPAELIYDEFENLIFEDHPLGHNILGSVKQVRGYTSDDAHRFTRQYYRPENCIFFVSGNINFKQLIKVLGTINGQEQVEKQKDKVLPEDLENKTIVRNRGTHQAHVMMGCRAFAADDIRRWALYLLNNILGGPGLNSRLNLSLRERHGLVYNVESTMVSYSDAGMWSVYFGCDSADVKKCMRLVRRELDKLMQTPLTCAQLKSAKRQLQGQLAIAADSREQFALDFAKNYLHSGKLRDLSDIMRHIDVLTANDLQQVAQYLFDEQRITTLIYQ